MALNAGREKRTLKVERALTRRNVSTETHSMSDPDAPSPGRRKMAVAEVDIFATDTMKVIEFNV